MQLIPTSSVKSWAMLGTSKAPTSISSVCPHCGEKVIFSLSGHHDDTGRLAIAAVARCPGCNQLTRFWALRNAQKPSDDKDNPAAVYMYPPAKSFYPSPKFSSDVPEPLQRAFVSAVDALNSHNYTATAVCARRTLEGIFKYLVPEAKRNASLEKMIELAKSEIDLSAPLTSLSHAVRDGGNLGAHFDMENEPDETLARQMVELVDYLISYLYVLPSEIEKVESKLGRSNQNVTLTIDPSCHTKYS